MTSRTTTIAVKAVVSGTPLATRTSQLAGKVVFADNPLAQSAQVGTVAVKAVIGEVTDSGPQTSQLLAKVVFGDAIVERFNQRAWTFNLDGHSFYVLHVGTLGTFVYDTRTAEWADWRTEGFPNWNMEQGFQLESGEVIAGDNQLPFIWQYKPELILDDDFRPIIHRVTGAVSMRRRETLNVYGFHMTASVGETQLTPTSLRVRFSDDQGQTFKEVFTQQFEEGNTTQVLNLRSLGTAKAPNRIFEIETEGNVSRIDGADLDTDQDA